MSKKLNTVEEYMAAKIRAKELENNPAVRTPLAMVLDISGSMAGTPIEQLNRGAQMLLHEILANVKERDHIDMTRKVSPLRQAEDAIPLDNSHMTIEEQKQWLQEQFQKAIND